MQILHRMIQVLRYKRLILIRNLPIPSKTYTLDSEQMLEAVHKKEKKKRTSIQSPKAGIECHLRNNSTLS